MSVDIAWAVALDHEADVTLDEMIGIARLSAWELEALAEFGATRAEVSQAGTLHRTYRASEIVGLRVAGRLREAFELDVTGIAVALALLERIATLETELSAALARIPRQPA